jgi:MFS family permease
MTLSRSNFRPSPVWVVVAGCAIALITFGPRSSLGVFQIPITSEYGWGRDTFGLAIAVQNLLWGVGAPFAGAVADRFGAPRVISIGALMYAAGLVVMAFGETPGTFQLGAGILIGFGLSAASFNLVLGAFAKLLPEKSRAMAFGAGTAAGSLGQFFFPPIGAMLIQSIGWHTALLWFAATLLFVLPLSLVLATPKADPAVTGNAPPPGITQSIPQALSEAFQHRSYVLLVLGFFTCGFQLAFITTHLPAFLRDSGLSPTVGGWTLAVIGLANAAGSLGSAG